MMIVRRDQNDMLLGSSPPNAERGGALRALLDALIDEGAELGDRFDREVRQRHWHPFVPSNYENVLESLIAEQTPGWKFLEWGSATGVVTIMADLLGFEAYGIELDAELIDVARQLAVRYQSSARFVAGSFVPAGYRWRPRSGDGRMATIGVGPSAYAELEHALDDFDLIYAYPWDGEKPMMLDLMKAYGRNGARLLLHGDHSIEVHQL